MRNRIQTSLISSGLIKYNFYFYFYFYFHNLHLNNQNTKTSTVLRLQHDHALRSYQWNRWQSSSSSQNANVNTLPELKYMNCHPFWGGEPFGCERKWSIENCQGQALMWIRYGIKTAGMKWENNLNVVANGTQETISCLAKLQSSPFLLWDLVVWLKSIKGPITTITSISVLRTSVSV